MTWCALRYSVDPHPIVEGHKTFVLEKSGYSARIRTAFIGSKIHFRHLSPTFGTKQNFLAVKLAVNSSFDAVEGVYFRVVMDAEDDRVGVRRQIGTPANATQG